jgi:hypothetical protein
MAETPLHPSFYALGARLAELRAPQGDFDARGAWKSRYGVYAADFLDERGARPIGRLTLERTPQEGGAELAVHLEEEHESQRLVRAGRARVRDDALSTLLDWELDTRLLPRRRGASEVRTHSAQTLEAWRPRPARIAGSPPPSSDWSLIDALQRWPADGEPPSAPFELLEEFESRRGEQRLQRIAPIELPLAGGSVRVSGLVRTGRGTPPVHYWLDGRGRVLFVLGYLRFLAWVDAG